MSSEISKRDWGRAEWRAWRPDARELRTEIGHYSALLRRALECNEPVEVKGCSETLERLASKAGELYGAAEPEEQVFGNCRTCGSYGRLAVGMCCHPCWESDW